MSLYSVVLCRLLAVKNGDEETRGRSAGQRVAGIGRTFFFFKFEAPVDIEVSAQAKSFFSRTKSCFEN